MPFKFVDATVSTTYAVLEFEFTGGDSSYANYRPLRLTVDDTKYSNKVYDSDDSGGSSSYWTIRVSGLTPNTTYTFEAQLGYYTGSTASWLSLYADGDFTTDPDVLPVDKWSWNASNGSASAAATQNAYKVLKGTLSADNFSYSVWNDLVDKVVEVRSAKGYGWDSVSGKYFTAANCKVSSGDTLSAQIYNSVKYNIGSVRATGILDVSAGDEIKGNLITTLTDVINEIIDGQ